jgi:hypothetical protein
MGFFEMARDTGWTCEKVVTEVVPSRLIRRRRLPRRSTLSHRFFYRDR